VPVFKYTVRVCVPAVRKADLMLSIVIFTVGVTSNIIPPALWVVLLTGCGVVITL
jgi:hypothetical protein